MGPDSPRDDAQPDPLISSLVGEYFDRRQGGEDLTTERFAAEHPEVADKLRPYLEGLALIDQARGLASSMLAEQSMTPPTELPRIKGYDPIEEIGRGGMGVVYKAWQVSTKRVVALKVMLAGAFASPSTRKRFEREVQLAARLQHAAIVRVLESGEVAGQPYYAMDYVQGVRLDRYLSDKRPSVRAVLGLFVQLCEAVEDAHSHGVIHRDLKPANVLIDAEGHPHVLDFGLAKATDEAGQTSTGFGAVSLAGQVVGTLFYLSPEQAAGAPGEIDARTDVYALGVMLYEALTGSLPMDASGPPSRVIRRILETPPTRPRSLSSRVDADLETILLKALEKEKGRRYPCARDMADDLRLYLAGEPIRARRPSGLYVLRKKLRKHRWGTVASAALLIVTLATVAAGLWWRQRDVADARRLAVAYQRDLEAGAVSHAYGLAQALYQRHPELPEVPLVWAQAQFRAEVMPDAPIRFLERQLRVDPSQWASRALLAEIYQAAGNSEQAEAMQGQAQREAPDTPEAWYLRSFATLDLRRAIHCTEQAIHGDPSHGLAWCRLTYLRLQAGELDGALEGADRLMALGLERTYWTGFKGQTLTRQGRIREAIAEYTRAGAYLERAHAYRRIKEYDKAVADYTYVLAKQRDTPNVWDFYQRATPLWILGRTGEALEDYRRVRSMLGRPFYSDARAYLILRGLGREREATEVLETALRDVQDAWLRQVFRCLAGQITPAELVAEGAARNNDKQLCEACYYAAEVCLLSHQAAEARGWFERCTQTGVAFDPDTAPAVPMNEHELAQWRLESLFSVAPASQP